MMRARNALRAGITATVVALAFTLGVAPATAQDATSTPEYQISFPLGDLKDFTDASASFRGFTYNFNKFIGRDSNISVGGMVGWQVFWNDLGVQTITLRDAQTEDGSTINGDVTGLQRRYLNAIPVMAKFNYYIGRARGVRLNVGINAGTMWAEQRAEVGLVAFTATNWHFAIAPEASVTFPINDRVFGYAGGRYYYAVGSGRNLIGETASWNYLSLNFGFSFYHGFF